MKAVLIAGGLGTRMRPLTDHIPKPILPLANKPFLVYKIEWLIKHGITEIILNLHHLPHRVKEITEVFKKQGIKFYFSMEEVPLGTCGAIKNAEEFFDAEPMVVCNADTLTDLDLSKMIEFHKKNKSLATISTIAVKDPTPYGLILADENSRIEKFIEKPDLETAGNNNRINAGTYIIDPALFKDVVAGKACSIEREFFPALLACSQPMYAFYEDCYWLDIGTPASYLEANKAVLMGEVEFKIQGNCLQNKVWQAKNVKIDKSAKVFGPTALADGVEIGRNAKIRPLTALGRNVKVGQDSEIERSVIMENTKIGQNAVVKGAILGAGCIVEDSVVIGQGVVLADKTIVKKGLKLGE